MLNRQTSKKTKHHPGNFDTLPFIRCKIVRLRKGKERFELYSCFHHVCKVNMLKRGGWHDINRLSEEWFNVWLSAFGFSQLKSVVNEQTLQPSIVFQAYPKNLLEADIYFLLKGWRVELWQHELYYCQPTITIFRQASKKNNNILFISSLIRCHHHGPFSYKEETLPSLSWLV